MIFHVRESVPGFTRTFCSSFFNCSLLIFLAEDMMRKLSYPMIMTPPSLCHTRSAAIRWERDFTVPSSETWTTKLVFFCTSLFYWLNPKWCSYFDSVLPHVALPFIELIDPVEDSIEGTNDQSSVELQVLWQQHRVEEGHHLLMLDKYINHDHLKIMRRSSGIHQCQPAGSCPGPCSEPGCSPSPGRSWPSWQTHSSCPR